MNRTGVSTVFRLLYYFMYLYITGVSTVFHLLYACINIHVLTPHIVQELCESRGGCPGLSVLTNLLVSVDVRNY